MQDGYSGRSHQIVNREVAEGLLESLRPTRRLLTRSLAEIPIGGPEYCQIDRVVREIDELAEILISDTIHSCEKEPSAPESGGG